MLDSLFSEIEAEGVEVRRHSFKSSNLKGLYTDGVITLNMPAIENQAELVCVLAEELGHHHTSYGNILDQKCLQKRKQERLAMNWAHRRLVPLISFISAFEAGVRNRHEFADLIGVTEKFLDNSIQYYLDKYGLCLPYDEKYIICFDPVGVIKLFD